MFNQLHLASRRVCLSHSFNIFPFELQFSTLSEYFHCKEVLQSLFIIKNVCEHNKSKIFLWSKSCGFSHIFACRKLDGVFYQLFWLCLIHFNLMIHWRFHAFPNYILYTSVVFFYLSKQSRPWWDTTNCGISSGSTLFVKVPTYWLPV